TPDDSAGRRLGLTGPPTGEPDRAPKPAAPQPVGHKEGREREQLIAPLAVQHHRDAVGGGPLEQWGPEEQVRRAGGDPPSPDVLERTSDRAAAADDDPRG